MRRSRFSEEEILAILHEQQTGKTAAEICARHRISPPTFYGWRTKFGGLSVTNAKRLKQLEGENSTLRRLLAAALLDNAVLKSGRDKDPERRSAEPASFSDGRNPSRPPSDINPVKSYRE